MNLSGQALAGLSRPGLPDPSEMLVILDDLALPLGVLRLRRGGSSGGQKGLESIVHAMNTVNVPRLRCGIGPLPEGVDPSEFVLSTFEQEELESVANMAERAARAVETAISEGFETAMNRWNAILRADAPEPGSLPESGSPSGSDKIF